jgi:hypothetical protein
MDYMSAASRGKAGGKAAVVTGHYVRYTSAAANLGATLSNTTATGLNACRVSCDDNVQCWGFYYNGVCDLRKGLEGEGHRSFIHVVGSRIEFQAGI